MDIGRVEIIHALSLHKGEILEAHEWRPLADHVLGLMALAWVKAQAQRQE